MTQHAAPSFQPPNAAQTRLTRRTALGCIAAAGASLAGLPTSALAQAIDWKQKPVQMLVGFPPGGINDVAARALVLAMAKSLGVTPLVINQPGAGGTIALQKLLQAPADGFTLLYTPSPTLLARPYQMSLRLSHRDVTPVANVATSFLTLSVKKSHKWQGFKDFLAEAKANPGKVAYATPGIGGLPHIAMENLTTQLGISLNHVPFQGLPPANMAVLGGQLDIVVGDLPHADLRPIAVIGDERAAFWPSVPCTRELGVGSSLIGRFSVVAPKGLPEPAAKALTAAVQAAMADAGFLKQLADQSLAPNFIRPAELMAMWDAEEPQYRALIDKLDLKSK